MRTNFELKRLSVKIIDVEVAGPEHNGICTKPFCRLGCVCASLECKPSLSLHCGRANCMLECKCQISKLKQNEESSVKLPVGTELFSASTLNHLQDQAKKDLAPWNASSLKRSYKPMIRRLFLVMECGPGKNA